jgi:hypothetical protein
VHERHGGRAGAEAEDATREDRDGMVAANATRTRRANGDRTAGGGAGLCRRPGVRPLQAAGAN